MSCLWIEANKMFKIRWIFKLNSNWFLCLFYYICHNFGFLFPNVPWTSWLCSPSSSSHPTLLIESALYNHILYNHNPVIGRYMMLMVTTWMSPDSSIFIEFVEWLFLHWFLTDYWHWCNKNLSKSSLSPSSVVYLLFSLSMDHV